MAVAASWAANDARLWHADGWPTASVGSSYPGCTDGVLPDFGRLVGCIEKRGSMLCPVHCLQNNLMGRTQRRLEESMAGLRWDDLSFESSADDMLDAQASMLATDGAPIILRLWDLNVANKDAPNTPTLGSQLESPQQFSPLPRLKFATPQNALYSPLKLFYNFWITR